MNSGNQGGGTTVPTSVISDLARILNRAIDDATVDYSGSIDWANKAGKPALAQFLQDAQQARANQQDAQQRVDKALTLLSELGDDKGPYGSGH